MMLPILLLKGDAELDAGPDGAIDEDEFLAEVPDLIPASVSGIHQFWKNNRTLRNPRSIRGRSSRRRRARG